MKLSIVIPVHNEKNTIEEIIKRIKAVDLDKEIIIVDDKSTDGTREILRDRFKNDSSIRLVFLGRNKGKSFAIRAGLTHVRGEVVIIQDADLEYDPKDYKKLIEPIRENRASVVYGSRFMNINKPLYMRRWIASKLSNKSCDMGHAYLSNFLGIQLLNFLVWALYGAKITDEATCYKAFKAEVLKRVKIRSRRFEFCPEITAKVCKMGYKIHEVPISYYPRTAEHGKKLNWKDGIVAIIVLLKYRFVD